jgi:hypothetical protein
MSCEEMDSPQIPHRDAELPRCLHLRRAEPMEAIPVGVPPGQLARSLGKSSASFSTSAMVAIGASVVSMASKARDHHKTAT